MSGLVYSQGKINKNGQRVKEWDLLYKFDTTKFFTQDNTYFKTKFDLIDYNSSIKEANNLKEAMYIEKVIYENGVKEGIFELCENVYKTKYVDVFGSSKKVNYNPLLIKGTYKNGKWDGKIDFFKNEEFQYSIIYSNGSPIDQSVKISTQVIKHPGKRDISYTFKEEFLFQFGKIVQIKTFGESGWPIQFIKTTSGWQVSNYTETPYCFNNFSFLTLDEINENRQKSLIELNTNNLGLEVYIIDKNLKKNGLYKLFQPGSTLFDTTFLSAKVNFIDGKRNGIARYWDRNRNGHFEHPFIESNYKNDKLQGTSIIYYTWSGKPAAIMNFENGLILGKLISFWDADKGNPFSGKYAAARCTFDGGFLLPWHVGDFNLEIINMLDQWRNKGKEMEKPTGYFRFTEQNYVLDSVFNIREKRYIKYSKVKGLFSWYSSENTKFADLIVNKDGELGDFMILDKNGKDIFNMKTLNGIVSKNLEDERKRRDELLNRMVKCDFCSKEEKIGNSKITWGGCDCFQDNGNEIGIYGTVSTYFCSQKCRTEYEKDCCRRSNYKYEKN
jgi:hypothetical protein